MSYIVIKNKGTVNIPLTVNLLGISVKDDANDPIGMFGSGLKYAMAQCLREGIELHISSNDEIYHLNTESIRFKNRIVERGVLVDSSGNSHPTPVTPEFGQHEWKEIWFIFRELYANALDETSDKNEALYSFADEPVSAQKRETVISIEKQPFNEMLLNFSDYFQIGRDNYVEDGKGLVFKHGIRVGQFKGSMLNWSHDQIQLSESRIMNEYRAIDKLCDLMYKCDDPYLWERLLSSSENFVKDVMIDFRYIYCKDRKAALYRTLHQALVNMYGDSYVIAPKSIASAIDLVSMGYKVVHLPKNWTIKLESPLRSWEMLGLAEAESTRTATSAEYERIVWGLSLIKQHYGVRFSPNDVKVLKTDHPIEGQANLASGMISLEESLFKSADSKFLQTIFHEIGHVKSKAGECDRNFTEWFIELMCENMISV